MNDTEGVTKFAGQHTDGRLAAHEAAAVERLLGWRQILSDLAVLGADPFRYDGLGFGNISHRIGPRSSPRGRRAFVVSGTQTSGVRDVGAEDFCVVEGYELRSGAVFSRGLVRPSSEAMTHASIYDQAPHIQCVLHVHSPDIWCNARALGVPETAADIAYGTVEMADAFRHILRDGRVRVVSMAGHRDGIVALGRDVDAAATALLVLLARARQPARTR